MRNLQYICFMLLVATAAGCIPSQAMTEGDIDHYWYLQEDAWGQAKRKTLELAGKQLPGGPLPTYHVRKSKTGVARTADHAVLAEKHSQQKVTYGF